jgi:3-isopropylmalate/(R)-2-methylmalate dehydratase small subunit
MGFPLAACPGILKTVERWHELTVTWQAGLVRNETTGCELKMEPLSRADYKMLQYGGLIPYLKASMVEQAKL